MGLHGKPVLWDYSKLLLWNAFPWIPSKGVVIRGRTQGKALQRQVSGTNFSEYKELITNTWAELHGYVLPGCQDRSLSALGNEMQ